MKSTQFILMAVILAFFISTSNAGIKEDVANEDLSVQQIISNAQQSGLTMQQILSQINDFAPNLIAETVAILIENNADNYQNIVQSALDLAPDQADLIVGSAVSANNEKVVEIVEMAIATACPSINGIAGLFADTCNAFAPIVTAAVENAVDSKQTIVQYLQNQYPGYNDIIITAADAGEEAARLAALIANNGDPGQAEATAAGTNQVNNPFVMNATVGELVGDIGGGLASPN